MQSGKKITLEDLGISGEEKESEQEHTAFEVQAIEMGLMQEVAEEEDEELPDWGDVGNKDEWGFTLPQDKESLMKGVLTEGEIEERSRDKLFDRDRLILMDIKEQIKENKEIWY